MMMAIVCLREMMTIPAPTIRPVPTVHAGMTSVYLSRAADVSADFDSF